MTANQRWKLEDIKRDIDLAVEISNYPADIIMLLQTIGRVVDALLEDQ